MQKLTSAVVLGLCCLYSFADAQGPDESIVLVMPHGPGKIQVNATGGFHADNLGLLDDGTRPVTGIINDKTGIDVSYILFPNDTPEPTAKSCGDAVVNVILDKTKPNATISGETRTPRTLKNGSSIYTVAFYEEKLASHPIHQQELFGFYGDKNTCAEVHISKSLFKPSNEPLLNEELEKFTYDPTYTPTSFDYGALAGIFYNAAKDYKASALYYKAALDTYDDKPLAKYDAKTIRRMMTDQLSMSYGMSGDLTHSREVNQAAITKDPDYPLYYYNLACADAEEGHTDAARNHLEQAFARKANTLPGETMPNPATDDSILKLKKDKDFWAFVQTLSKS